MNNKFIERLRELNKDKGQIISNTLNEMTNETGQIVLEPKQAADLIKEIAVLEELVNSQGALIASLHKVIEGDK